MSPPNVHKVSFDAHLSGPSAVFKVDDGGEERFIIWGKASVEVVDKEGDKITAEALKKALPQLLRRSRLSVEHTDQLVGKVKESFETDEPVTVEIDGKEYTRKEFPTDVLQLEGEEPALFVAGEVWDDTKQARQVREDIEAGEIDSYSISGEAISDATKVKDGDVFDEITELDLSAITLCEEGMNQEAKFGTVVKIGGDESVSPSRGGMSSPGVAVVKTGNSNEMTNSTDEAESGGETLKAEELHSEFKSAAQEALAESDFVTAAEVKSMMDGHLEASADTEKEGDADYEEDEPSNPSEAAGEDADDAEKSHEDLPEELEAELEDEEREGGSVSPERAGEILDRLTEEPGGGEEFEAAEKAVPLGALAAGAAGGMMGGGGDKAEDEDEPPEDSPEEPPEPDAPDEAPDEAPDAPSPDEEEDVIEDAPDEPDAPEPDAPELDAPDEPEDDVVPDDPGGDITSQLEEEGVPDDLVDAVSEYVGGGPEEEPGEEEEIELEDEDDESDEDDEDESDSTEKQEAIGGGDLDDLSKAETDEEYLDMTASGVVPALDEEEDLAKSFEHEGPDDPEPAENPSTLDAFYQSVGEEV